MRVTAILCVRNEGARILEWLAHHRAIGITDVLAFSNDCQDGTDALLDRLQALGQLTHIRNDGASEKGPQWAALRMADRHPLVRRADWLITLDIDEFIHVRVGDGTLAALTAALPDATAIALTWRFFGNAGQVEIPDRILPAFTRAAPSVLHWPWRGALIKTLFRNDGTYRALGVHRPRQPDPARIDAARWFDGSGRPLPEAFRRTRLFTNPGQDCHGLVQLNHYALGAMHDYLVKCDRGRANREGAPFDMGYWIDRNFSDVEDRGILRLAPRSGPILTGFLSDSDLAQRHLSALRWRRDRAAQLLREEPWRAFLGRLMMAPPSRCLGPDEARTIREHGRSGAEPA